ncbi:central glycolytic genes regulator [Secundilactobacillus oryzae JCM 18671]|uniref:Central glycolytic genes regulator n=1 Tax=Secundilactobacillus oryzae JCM 18671 TaxID=1291743 RepID=A0A081BKD9_9LACO|nr:sugar-binding domain-containing protein [Secundilactobacillus oryzae]GAK48507.1 central glycolytic genes regulator [Secundilactobacillus oryzae JCM 18671]
MNNEWHWINKIVPDLQEKLISRYLLLEAIAQLQPVGRRTLADKMALSERSMRTETENLKDLNLVSIDKVGMQLTSSGSRLLKELKPTIDKLLGRQQRAEQLQRVLGIQCCTIVPGNSDESQDVLETMGKTAESVLLDQLPEGESIIAVMGGSTMVSVAQQMTQALTKNRQLTFVPARGGIGEAPALQANAVSAKMAEQTGSKFRSLFIPESISKEAIASLQSDPAISDILDLIKSSNVAIHGIGEAIQMAERRQMSQTLIQTLKKKRAVGEAFGYFFDEDGNVVYKLPRIGLQLEDLAKKDFVLAVAGGSLKAAAIQAYAKIAPKQTWLITDEGAADMILKK